MASCAPFLALGALLLARPAASAALNTAANFVPRNYGAAVPWDERVPGQWVNWQAWSELAIVRREGHRDFVFCALPKAGCTVWKQMMLRASGVSHWNTTDKFLIHSPLESGLGLIGLPGSRYYHASVQTPSEFYTMMGPESKAYKAAIVRDPAVRLLSAYLDRCVDEKEWYRCLSSQPVSFSKVVELYERGAPDDTENDIHFRNQTTLCGLQYKNFTKWDAIGHYESFIAASEHILRENDMWNNFGATGWGPHGNASFGVEEQQMSNHLGTHRTEYHMCEYYTSELLDRVWKLYKPDYLRFGYYTSTWKQQCKSVWEARARQELNHKDATRGASPR